MKTNWITTILYLIFGIWLLRFPPTRAIIIWLLPLGSGWDDAIQIVAIVVIVGILITKNLAFGSKFRTRFNKFKRFFK